MILRFARYIVRRFSVWWRRAGNAMRVAVFTVGSLFLALLVFLQRPQSETTYPGGYLLFFVAGNLAIVILLVLVFLVGRNIVKLVFDRRHNIFGSKLRLKLVTSFVGLILVPTTILFILASGLLNSAIEGWFSAPVDAAVSGAIDVAREHFTLIREQTVRAAQGLRQNIDARKTGLSTAREWASLLESERSARSLFSVRIVDESRTTIHSATHAAEGIEDFAEPNLNGDFVRQALRGHTEVRAEERGASRYFRVYAPLTLGGESYALVTTARLSSEFSSAMESVNNSKREYEQLKFFKNPLKSNLVLYLSVITGLLLFAALWVGFYIARALVTPIQKLAAGADQVAKGNYNVKIPAQGDDEIGLLVARFNEMTSDLRLASESAEARRQFIEAILSHLAVGVIGLDTEHKVTSVNYAAQQLYGIRTLTGVIGSDLSLVLREEDFEQIRSLLESVQEPSPDEEEYAVEREINVLSGGRELKILCTAGPVLDEDEKRVGTVLLFDDVTELAKAQHMSAWREVARRIAHEIKNPLTPIQLSAQRLQKLAGGGDKEGIINECTQTIVEHVSSIKRLANEFSHFARMPTAELAPAALNSLVGDTLAPFAEIHSEITFQFIPDEDLPDIPLDREQIRRVLINLIDNAIAALQLLNAHDERRIVVKTRYDRRRKLASMEVSDSGPGIPEGQKLRIFEPYFTTKKTGTGLGLAIVTSIVSDHQGTIRVYDHAPRGAKFIIELPLSQKNVTQRRFAR